MKSLIASAKRALLNISSNKIMAYAEQGKMDKAASLLAKKKKDLADLKIDDKPLLHSILADVETVGSLFQELNTKPEPADFYNQVFKVGLSYQDELPLLAFALVNGKLDEAKVMVEGGANVFMQLSGNNNLIHFVLMSTSEHGKEKKPEILKYLIEKGVPVNDKNSEVT